MIPERPVLGVIGLGKVGETLARLYFERGYRIAAVSSRDAARGQAIAQRIGAVLCTPSQTAAAADLTLLTVPDDAIVSVADGIDGIVTGKAFVHVSGALDVGVLDSLEQRGARVGSFHPVFPFADVDAAVTGLPGSAFGVETNDNRLRIWLSDLANALDGTVMVIPQGAKSVYHAALVIASNYTVTLYSVARNLLMTIGAEGSTADYALRALLTGTVANLREKSVSEALTGPLVRGDVGTVSANLEALDVTDPDAAALYRILAKLTLPLVEARGRATDDLKRLF